MKLITLKALLLLSFLPFVEAETKCWNSKWVKEPQIEDFRYRYYVGRASGHVGDPEKTLIDHATKDAREAAIAENFGVLTSFQKQSYQSLGSETDASQSFAVSKNVFLKGFLRKDICWKIRKEKKDLWVLFSYSKKEINKELKRIEKEKFVNKPLIFSKMDLSEKKSGGFLEVVTSPPGVSISVGQYHGKTPVQVYLDSGVHKFILDHENYKAYEGKVVIEKGKTHRVKKLMEQAKRRVQIKTQPQGAEVYMAGKYLGLTPIKAQVFTGENIKLSITHPETRPYHTYIEVGKGTKDYLWKEKLHFKPSHLFVKSMPQGADVYLDGKFVGKTPTKFIETRHGRRKLILKKSGYHQYKTYVNLKGGERRILKTIKFAYRTNNKVNIADKGSPLHIAAYKGSPLHIAAYKGKAEVVRKLIKGGADVHSKYNLQRVTPLYWAAQEGHSKVVELLLKNGANPNVKDKEGRTPLYWAAQEGHSKVVDLLLKNDAKPDVKDKEGWAPLHITAIKGDSKVVGLLLKSGANPDVKHKEGRTPLYWAAQEGHSKVVGLLLKSGANPNVKHKEGRTPLYWAAQEGHSKVAELLLKNGANPNVKDKKLGWTPLHVAAQEGHSKVTELLLKNGANPNIKDKKPGWTPLHVAAHQGHSKVTELLLKSSAKPDVKDKKPGWTPLHIAAQEGHSKVVELLLKNGANPNVKDKKFGWTPLYWAAPKGHFKVMELLLKNGANPNVKNKKGWIPLYWAAKNWHSEVAELLLKNGANSDDVRHKKGRTPLHIAALKGHSKAAELLLKNGANSNAKEKGGRTPLHIAALKGHSKVVELLLKSGAKPNVKDKKGRTPLHIADTKEVLELLRDSHKIRSLFQRK